MNRTRTEHFSSALARTNWVVAFSLLSVAAIAWMASVFLMSDMMSMDAPMGLPIMGMYSFFQSANLLSFMFFLLVWTVGMVAMMFPAMVPVVSAYVKLLSRDADSNGLALDTSLFLVGYLVLYVVLGVGAFTLIYSAFYFSSLVTSLSAYALPAASAVLIAAGV